MNAIVSTRPEFAGEKAGCLLFWWWGGRLADFLWSLHRLSFSFFVVVFSNHRHSNNPIGELFEPTVRYRSHSLLRFFSKESLTVVIQIQYKKCRASPQPRTIIYVNSPDTLRRFLDIFRDLPATSRSICIDVVGSMLDQVTEVHVPFHL